MSWKPITSLALSDNSNLRVSTSEEAGVQGRAVEVVLQSACIWQRPKPVSKSAGIAFSPNMEHVDEVQYLATPLS